MKILVLNAGSSSQKSCLYELTGDRLPDRPLPPLWEAQVDWTHTAGFAEIQIKTSQGAHLSEKLETTARSAVITHLLDTLHQGDTKVIEQLAEIDAVGHRVVHGGSHYSNSTRVTEAVKAAIAQLAVLAPAHNPANLEGMEAIAHVLPSVPQVAVFDTAFHAHMPQVATLYPGPYAWYEQGIRRYGFHGISHQYCAQRAAEILGKELTSLKLITCHLGNGCSLAAIANGQSIDTTMGFTPLDGLMMGSRSGSVDPGILIHLLRHEQYTADQLDEVLNHQSGLKGISGLSADMRQVAEAAAHGHDRATLALALYVYRLRASIGALLANLGGLDALVFTAGVGENSAMVRAATCDSLKFLGITLDSEKNQQVTGDADLATPDSAIRVVVVHTQEDWAIAQEVWRVIQEN